MNGLFAALGDLRLEVERVRLEPRQLRTASGWVRHTTVVVLEGGRDALGRILKGAGEDVVYETSVQRAFRSHGPPDSVCGSWSLHDLSLHLRELDLFPEPPLDPPADRNYRRWAFESAAVDLALRQSGASLSDALGRSPRPMRYVVSVGLEGTPANIARLEVTHASFPSIGFKVDVAESWTLETVSSLRRFVEIGGQIDIVDFKARYESESFQGPRLDPDLYAAVADALPGALLEDPHLSVATTGGLAPFRNRISWDAPLLGVSDLDALPFTPGAVNIKPSRFGSWAELGRAYAWCESNDVEVYMGGQFELDVGRRQLQMLASLLHPDAPNDASPVSFHRESAPSDAPNSLIPVPGVGPGF